MIIKTSKMDLSKSPYQNILYPDQFVSEHKKLTSEEYIKNYDLVNGILTGQDFYEEPEVKSFTQQLLDDMELPKYVQHYSIFNGPLNTIIGELNKRPDNHRVKAYDDDSRSEEMQFRTELLNKYVYQKIKEQIYGRMAALGQQPEEDEVDKLTLEQVKNEISDYTSEVESWANHMLTACKR